MREVQEEWRKRQQLLTTQEAAMADAKRQLHKQHTALAAEVRQWKKKP